MNLQDFRRRMIDYEAKARARAPEYLNSSLADTPWDVRVTYELLIDCIEKQDELLEILRPAPEHEDAFEVKE